MKTISKYFIPSVLAVMALTGCSGDANEPATVGTKDAPDFTATIGSVATRATDRTWDRGDQIGISGCGRTNVCYATANADGNFSVKTAGEQIYFQNDAAAEFTAYYPWNALTGGGSSIAADTRNQQNQKSFDFLWAKGSGKKSEPTVAFNFSHKMTKVVFTVKPGDGMTYDEIKRAQLSLGGVRHTGSFNTVSGSTAVNGATTVWTFPNLSVANDADRTLTFSFILFPQVFDNTLEFSAVLNQSANNTLSLKAGIDFTAANLGLDGNAAKNEWVAGRQYTLSLTLHKTDITLGQSTINTWTSVTPGGDIVVD